MIRLVCVHGNPADIKCDKCEYEKEHKTHIGPRMIDTVVASATPPSTSGPAFFANGDPKDVGALNIRLSQIDNNAQKEKHDLRLRFIQNRGWHKTFCNGKKVWYKIEHLTKGDSDITNVLHMYDNIADCVHAEAVLECKYKEELIVEKCIDKPEPRLG